MPNKKNILHELEIACAILKTDPANLARKWGISRTWVVYVAEGVGKSKKIRKKIMEVIAEAKKIVPFEYPYNN